MEQVEKSSWAISLWACCQHDRICTFNNNYKGMHKFCSLEFILAMPRTGKRSIVF